MPYSYATYTGNGSTTQFAVPFGYIRREHVLATVATVSATFTWVNDSLIQMTTAPANGAAVRVYRLTPLTAPLVDFADGATLVAADLDTNAKQSIYTQQELDDALVGVALGAIPNGDKGDITTSVGGTVWTIDSGAVTSDKIANGTILNADVNASAGIVATKLAFTQSGTGATARTVDSKLKDVVSVKDFGATGNGTTDDTAAIQAAINAALSQPITSGGAGSVFFPAGAYKVTSTINIPPRSGQTYNVGLRIYGEGNAGNGSANTNLIAATGFTGTGVLKYNQGVIPISVNEVSLEFDHFGIVGQHNVAQGIEIFNPIGVSIHDVSVTFCTGSCIKLTGGECYSVNVQDVYLHGSNPTINANPAEYGIESTARYAMFNRIVIDGGQTAIRLTGDNNIVQNCHLEGSATGIDLDVTGGGLARITSNLLNPYGAGLSGWPASGTAIRIRGVGAGAGLRNFVGFNQITAATGAASAGIYLDSAYQTQIFANKIESAVNGIYLTASAAADRVHYIEGNNFIGCTNDINNQIAGGRIEVGGGNFGDTGGVLTFAGSTSPIVGYQWGPQAVWARHGTTFTGNSAVDGLILYNGQTDDVGDAIRLKFDFSNSGPGSQARSASITGRSKLNYGSATELVFSTANDSVAEAERLIIQKDGILRPAVDNAYSFGTSGFRWTTIYATTGTINTSDGSQKQQIAELSEAERTVATAIKGLIRKFKFNDAVEAKGDDARIHVGVIAQDVEQAFIDEGLDPAEYGLFCRDEWWELDGEIVNQDTDGAIRKERLGIRYEELLAFVVSAL